MTLRLPIARAQAHCDNHVDAVDAGTGAGTLEIYNGTLPADADASGATTPTDDLLATLTMNDPAFGAAADVSPGARATANAITGDTSADASGTAGWFRLLDSDGTIVHIGTVTATGGGGELELVTTSIVAGQPVNISSMTVTFPQS